MLAIIDGDVLCYQACQARWKIKARNGMNIVSLDDEGVTMPLEYTEEEDRIYLEDSFDNLLRIVEEVVENNFADDYVMAVKGDGNFRSDLFHEYKLNRANSKYHSELAKFIPTLRNLLINLEMAIPAHNREADDLVRIWAEEARSNGEEFTICSIDKDLQCIAGRHYLMHPKYKTVSERILHVSEQDAMEFYYAQLISGDPTDNIKGVPGLGPKKAKARIKGKEENDMQYEVVNAYFEAFGEEDWLEQLVVNGRLIHIQKTVDDYFNPHEWDIVKELT